MITKFEKINKQTIEGEEVDVVEEVSEAEATQVHICNHDDKTAGGCKIITKTKWQELKALEK